MNSGMSREKQVSEAWDTRVKRIDNPKNYDLAVLTNINFNRPLLDYFKKHGVMVATDVHILSDVDDQYNEDFLASADILFLSNEGSLGHEKEFIQEIYNKYHNHIIVMGCGEEGAIAYVGKEDKFIEKDAVAPKGVVNTVGAGDALFSGFVHYYKKTLNIEKSLQFAVIFAGIKVSASGGANGFVDEETILEYLN